jgi:DNA-binding LacI/PurR family transcriptional regulator
MVQPRLTVVGQYPEEIGQEAARLLVERLTIQGRSKRRVIRIPVELRVRESA